MIIEGMVEGLEGAYNGGQEEKMETVLDEFGRIALPRQVRDDLHLEPGTKLRIEEQGGGIFLKPVEEETPLVLKNGVLVFVGELEGNPEEALDRDRADRIRDLLGLGQE
jgi:AbrB family looped-hinge helix DNA binding protein